MKYLMMILVLVLAACAAPVEPSTPTEPAPQEEPIVESNPDVTFALTGENFAFYEGAAENPDLIVNEGDLVRIEFESTQGMHDWVVDEFDAATEIVRDGEGMTAVEFVADRTGTFEYYCSVGSHRSAGMVGNLIVQ